MVVDMYPHWKGFSSKSFVELHPKRTERALRESEERYRLLVNGAKDHANILLDPDGRVVSWNSGAQRIKGYTEQEIIGRHMPCFYVPEDVEHGEPQRLPSLCLTLWAVSIAA